MTTTRTLRALPIDHDVLDGLRARGQDGFGNPLRTAPAEGWEPLRCCLRYAAAGEPIVLISYSPHRRPSPWAEVGPVFVHAQRCVGPADADLPAELRDGPRVVRAYRADGSMAYAANAVVPAGDDVEARVRAAFEHADVVTVHVRAYESQCFLYAVVCD